jgi:PST family polysaccharide transporter
MLAFIGMPLGAILFLISGDLILLLLGPQWDQTGRLFSILSLSTGISLISMTSGWLNLSLGRADRQMMLTIFTAIVTTLFYVMGLPFGSSGVATAFAVTPYVLLGPSLWYSGRPIDLKLSLIISVIWKYFISAVLAGAMSWCLFFSLKSSAHLFTGLNIVIRIILPSIVCLAIYMILIIVLYQGTAPISQFLALVRDMVPTSRRRDKDNRAATRTEEEKQWQ